MWLRTIGNPYEEMTWGSKNKKWRLMVIAAGTAAVFMGDLLTPLGLVLWVAYIPLCLIVFWQMGRGAAVLLAILYSGLIVAGLFTSPPGISFNWAVINRVVGLCALWGGLWAGEIACREWSRLSRGMRQSERFLRLVLEHLPDMVFVKDAANLRFVALNKAGENLLGLTNQELYGKTDYDLFPKAEADFFVEKDREVLASGHLLNIGEETILTKCKGVRVLHTKKVPICDEDGVPCYLLGLSEDITEQKNREACDVLRLRKLKRLTEVSLMITGNPMEVFEQIVGAIGELFEVPVVCLSEIVGQELKFKTVYVKGQVFREAGGCPLEITPCATVEQTKDLRVFERVMERFPQASFLKDHEAFAYCGFPALDSHGRVVAVTCLLDDKPHAFTEEDQALLRAFGQRVAAEVERGKYQAERKGMEVALRESEQRLREAQQLAQCGNWELDLETSRLFWSDEIFRIFEIDKTKFAASYEGFLNAVHPDDRAMVNEAYQQSVQNRTAYLIVHRLLMPDGRIKHVQERGETFYDAQGQPRRSVGTVQDISEQRVAELGIAQALQEKEMLLREIHHRVKNNLQLVSSLLYFQSKKVRSEEDLVVIHELQDRIKSMILVHEKLYRSGDLAHIVFGDYVRDLAESIGRSYERMRGRIEVLVDAQPVTLPVEVALPAGLIVNELLTNAFKYAFSDGGGEIRMRVLNGDGRVEIVVEDTGAGLPAEFDLQTAATFGMQLMRGLAAQVGGTITFESGRGTAARLTVPLPE